MTIIEYGKCKIERLNEDGLGISRTFGGLVELPYILPGEIVEFERHKYRGRTNCILKKITQESPARITPICKYFSICGGCSLQHLRFDEYIEFKTGLIQNLLNQAQILTTLKPLITIPFGNRRRVNLKVLKKNNYIYLGFYRFRSHQIINIDECPVILKNLSELIIPLKQLCDLVLIDRQKAELLLNQASNGVHAAFIRKDYISLTDTQTKELISFAENNKIIQIIFESEKSKRIIYQSEQPFIVFDDKKIDIEAGSFLQTSTQSDIIFKELVLNFFSEHGENSSITVVDMFCGRGTFTIPLTKYFNVKAFESDFAAVAALDYAIKTYDLPATAVCRNLFTNPISKDDLDNFDYVVINPPRVGASAQCQELALSNIKKIAYISCNPQSFISDAKILIDGGYDLLEVTPVDQFPMTAHIEIVAIFQKINI